MRKIILDFDGVLFDSAVEAHAVCESVPKNWNNLSLKTFSFPDFMKFRKHINTSTDFLTYYLDDTIIDQKLKSQFKAIFYAQRKTLSVSDGYVKKYFPPYKFFHDIKELISENPDSFYILSTRDEESIKSTLKHYVEFNSENIIGQAVYSVAGSKVNALQERGLDLSHCLYIDDLCSHLIPFEKHSTNLLQADWGYGDLDMSYSADMNSAFQQVVEWLNGA